VTAGRNPSTKVLSIGELGAGQEVAAALKVAVGSPVLEIERLRCADETPLAVMRNYVPTGFLELPITAEALVNQGLYEVLRDHGAQFHSAHQVIGARTATPAEAKLLGAARNSTVLTMVRTAHDPQGRTIELGQHAYLASRYSFELSVFSQ
jgi:DNA-binding GntR family transcriptional regulator